MEDDLRVVADDGVVRVVFSGAFSLVAAKQALQKTVDACRENRCKRVLFDCRPMRGEISTMDRYEIGTYGGTAIPHGVMVALVARENQISPDKFLENVAVNRGVNLRVFSNLKQAADWLGR